VLNIDNSTVDDLKRGWQFDAERGVYQCLYCSASFEKGLVYPLGQQFCTADRAILQHVTDKHGSSFEQLLRLDKRFIGLTETQKALLRMMYDGKSNLEIAQATGNAASTIRAQRFLFREKARQARLMLAMAELLEEHEKLGQIQTDRPDDSISPIHATAAQIDERFAITAADKASVVKNYCLSTEPLVIKALPVKEKRKLVLLAMIANHFAESRQYSEKEVNEIIRPIFADYVTIRRYLIEYGYLDRTTNGSAYWVKNGSVAKADNY